MKNYFLHKSCFVDENVSIGNGTKIWHFSHISKNAKIGKNVIIGQNIFVGEGVKIGDNCKIQNNVSIYAGVTLEEKVFCGPSCVFTNVKNPRADLEKKDQFSETLVKKGATIGANSTIICGTTLGQFCLVAAGSVVTKNVKNYSLVSGSPAQHQYWISEHGEKLTPSLECPVTKKQYKLVNQELKKND